MRLLSLCVYVFALAGVVSISLDERFQVDRNRSKVYNVTFEPTLPDNCFVCRGGLQLDLRNTSRLLIGICTTYVMQLSGGFATLPLANLSEPPTRIIGDPTQPIPPSGDWDGSPPKIVSPQSFYQHSNKTTVFFVDYNSCVRELNRDTNNVMTIIGKGKCANNSLDLVGYAGDNFVFGMIYDEASNMFYFSVDSKGVYAYKGTEGSYTGTLIIENNAVSGIKSDTYELFLHGDYIWQKVRFGINRYKVSTLNHTGLNTHDDDTFVRFLSSAGSGTVDATARYVYTNDTIELGVRYGQLLLDPSGTALTIVDYNADNSLFLMDINTGQLTKYCYVNCPQLTGKFTSALWLNQYQVIVAAESQTVADVHFEAPPTTTMPTTTTTPTTTTSLPDEELGPGAIAGIVIGSLIGLAALVAVVWFAYSRVNRKKRSNRANV